MVGDTRLPLGFVTGLIAETRWAKAACQQAGLTPPLTAAAGGCPDRAAALTRRLIERGAHAILSFGLAGGLDPMVPTGMLVIADSVISLAKGDANIASPLVCDRHWVAALARREGMPPGLRVAPVLGSDRVIARSEEKLALYEETGAIAVDMESRSVVQAAHEAGCPVVVIRAISDPASRTIPKSALAGMGTNGRTHPGAVLTALLHRPWEIPAIVRLAIDSQAAATTLKHLDLHYP